MSSVRINKYCPVCGKTRLVWTRSAVGWCQSCASKANTGWHHTEETKRVLSLKSKATTKGISPACRKAAILAQTGRPKSTETRAKISLSLRGRKRPDISARMRGRKLSEEHKAKTSRAEKGVPKPKPQTQEYKSKISGIVMALWDKPEYVAMQMKARGVKPNKIETEFGKALSLHFPGVWAYTGDGTLIIDGKCPDFANTAGAKALIDVFGDYWHRGEDPQLRINAFERHGYRCLVIWEHEIKQDIIAVLFKIAMFTRDSPPLPEGFRYSSDTNAQMLSKEELSKIISQTY